MCNAAEISITIANLHFFAYFLYVFKSLLVEAVADTFSERALFVIRA